MLDASKLKNEYVFCNKTVFDVIVGIYGHHDMNIVNGT